MAELRYVDWDGLVYYDGKVKQFIADKLEDCVKMGGATTFDNLPSPSFQNLNYIYKITTEFTSDECFEKPGYIYKAGTWVQVVDLDGVYLYTIFNEEDISPSNPIDPGTVDLTNYYTKDEVDGIVREFPTKADVNQAIDDAIEIGTAGLVTKEEFDVVQHQAAVHDVKFMQLDSDLVDINQRIDGIVVPDLDGYATEAWVNEQGFLKEHQDLSEYAKKSDIPQPELFVIDYNSPNFADAFDAYKAGKLLLLANVAPDVDSYAIMNYVRNDMITFTKFLMSRSGTYGAFNTYYLHSDNTWEVAKEVKLNKVEAKVDDNNNISELVIGKDTYDFDNFATTEVVNQINENVQNIENTYVTNETLQNNYVSNTYITENYTTNEQLEATYVTNEKVTEVVTQEVNTVVTEQIETKVTEVIQEKVDAGEITVQSDSISYDTWE